MRLKFRKDVPVREAPQQASVAPRVHFAIVCCFFAACSAPTGAADAFALSNWCMCMLNLSRLAFKVENAASACSPQHHKVPHHGY